jgi:hypothetical protein
MRPAVRSLIDLAAIFVAAFLFVEQLGDPVARLQATVASTLESFQRTHDAARAPEDVEEGGMDIIHVCFVLNDFDAGRRMGLLAGLPIVLIASVARRSKHLSGVPGRVTLHAR